MWTYEQVEEYRRLLENAEQERQEKEQAERAARDERLKMALVKYREGR
jgi:DNA-binding protein H-NS